MRKLTISSINDKKIIAIVRGLEREMLLPVCDALTSGGVKVMEITFDQSGRISDSDVAENIAMLREHFDSDVSIGAGTVITSEQVELTHRAGGSFIISPNTKREVIERTRELNMVSIPGAFTPSEIIDAYGYGADFVKLFPVTSLGADYVKAIKAPLSHIPMLAVGGVDLTNVKAYLAAGVSGFGIGTNIINRDMVKNRDFDGIANLARCYVEAVNV